MAGIIVFILIFVVIFFRSIAKGGTNEEAAEQGFSGLLIVLRIIAILFGIGFISFLISN